VSVAHTLLTGRDPSAPRGLADLVRLRLMSTIAASDETCLREAGMFAKSRRRG
jgi:hypothetical protein